MLCEDDDDDDVMLVEKCVFVIDIDLFEETYLYLLD